MLKEAKRPLVIVGKGVAYANAQDEMRTFIKNTNLPVLATPMGKGVISDASPNSVAAARSMVL